jgi:hypothetical protein
MDKISIHQNVFIEVQEGNSDLTIIPIAINVEFLAAMRKGPKYLYGQIHEYKFEFLDSQVSMQEC